MLKEKLGKRLLKNRLCPARMRLDIGCGFDWTGDVNVDIRIIHPTPKNFVVCDCSALPFKNQIFNRVYASHVLEHNSFRTIINILGEWKRVLNRGGAFEIEVPNLMSLEVLSYMFLGSAYKTQKHGIPEFFGEHGRGLGAIYGQQDYEQNFHKSGFTAKALRVLLNQIGMKDIMIEGHGENTFLPFFKNKHVRWLYRKTGLVRFPQSFLNSLRVTARK